MQILQDIIENVDNTNPDILHLAAVPESLLPEDLQKLRKQLPHPKMMRRIPARGRESVDWATQDGAVADSLLLDTQKTVGWAVIADNLILIAKLLPTQG